MIQDPIGLEVTQEVAQIALLVWRVGKRPMLHQFHEQGQAAGGAMDILQQIAQALQRAA